MKKNKRILNCLRCKKCLNLVAVIPLPNAMSIDDKVLDNTLCTKCFVREET